jgi:hypothetical protein
LPNFDIKKLEIYNYKNKNKNKNPALEVGKQVGGGEVLHLPPKNCKLKLLAWLLECVSKHKLLIY